jgi:hypothetical protein
MSNNQERQPDDTEVRRDQRFTGIFDEIVDSNDATGEFRLNLHTLGSSSSASTRRSYGAKQRQFKEFCQEQYGDMQGLVSVERIGNFLASQLGRTHIPRTRRINVSENE